MTKWGNSINKVEWYFYIKTNKSDVFQRECGDDGSDDDVMMTGERKDPSDDAIAPL